MTQKKWTFALKPKRSTTYGLSTELPLISPFQKCLNINTDKNHISFARSGTALLGVCTCTELGREHNSQGKGRRRHAPPGHRPRVHRPRPRAPPHSDRAGSANARESHLGFHVCHVPKDQDRLESRKLLALTGDCVAPEHLQSCRGQGSAAGFGPLLEAFVIGYNPRHSAFRAGRRRGSAGKGRGRGGWPAARSRLGGESQVRRTRGPGARSRHAGESPRRRGGRYRGTGAAAGAAARTRRSARRRRCPRAPSVPAPGGAPHPSPAPAVSAMAPRKNAKGGGGNSSSSGSGSPSAGTSGGSSSPGARRGQRRSRAGVWGAGTGRRGAARAAGAGAASLPLPPRVSHHPRCLSFWRGAWGRARWAWRAGWRGRVARVRGLGWVAPGSRFPADPSPAGRSLDGGYWSALSRLTVDLKIE